MDAKQNLILFMTGQNKKEGRKIQGTERDRDELEGISPFDLFSVTPEREKG